MTVWIDVVYPVLHANSNEFFKILLLVGRICFKAVFDFRIFFLFQSGFPTYNFHSLPEAMHLLVSHLLLDWNFHIRPHVPLLL